MKTYTSGGFYPVPRLKIWQRLFSGAMRVRSTPFKGIRIVAVARVRHACDSPRERVVRVSRLLPPHRAARDAVPKRRSMGWVEYAASISFV